MEIVLNLLYLLYICSETSQKAELKRTPRRGKEKMAYISNSEARSSALYWRKATLFQKARALHTMTKAEVIIVIDHKGQRFVGGSLGLLETYNKGTLKPTQAEQRYDAPDISTSPDRPEIEPLQDTPEHINIVRRLAGVLGHSLTRHETRVPPSRKRLHYDIPDTAIPTPVKELLLNKPVPQLTDKEKTDVPTVQQQSKISFISDESIEIFVAGE